MISDEAVEAAAHSLARSRGFDPDEIIRRNGERHVAWRAYLPDARAALQAALPVLLEGRAEEIARLVDRAIVFFDEEGGDKFTSRDAANRIISILTGDGK